VAVPPHHQTSGLMESRQNSTFTATLTLSRSTVSHSTDTTTSLRPFAASQLLACFNNGREDAERETGLLRLPDVCPWTFEQISARDFWPH
jgi:Domain of unknown function DUF29